MGVTTPQVLTVNAGSSSLRLASYTMESTPRRVAETHISSSPTCDAGVLTDYIRRHALATPELVMHRVVHGGQTLGEPCLINAEVEAEIQRLRTLAPMHNGLALGWINAARQAFGPRVRQAACFDTGFYKNLPAAAAHYALPRELSEQHGIRRYGFHGLAHQSMLNQWHERRHMDSNGRVISLQLGGGCSATASVQSEPVETSMGFSPLEGLVMSSRCGDLDPSVVLYLIDEAGFDTAELSWILNGSSGLLGVSGQSGDMQTLLESETADAALAINVFCHRVRQYIGAYLAVLGGAEAILFGGGIGEHAPVIRARVLEHFEWAGIQLDARRNMSIRSNAGGPIHDGDSTVEVWVTPTDEGRVMADAASTLLMSMMQSA